MNYLKGSIALSVAVGLVAGPLYGEDRPHAEFLSVSPTLTSDIAASGGLVRSNVSAQVVALTYHPAELNIEQLIPHDHLVIQTSELTPPTGKVNCSSIVIPGTGPDPFFLRRQRSSRPEVLAPKRPPFWCDSFQKFRSRMT